MNNTPAWLTSQQQDRARTTDSLHAAADQMNVCLNIAANLHAQGLEHFDDPYHQAAVRESHRLDRIAEAHGHNIHDIGAEAARRREAGA